ncbi:hypothetical protein PGT21_034493 [Puccinia graminis f. sp. tritici]|uniref:Uncharacterized protein n=1 Tax=Puccinia graminis f. sp. tritici TaxID=56615 RepID=A0A5B0LYB6_PUCGR|nr:hypothetical protein PGT21_034493 [Puccinia graminis f. sp. tritici]
MLLGCFKKEQFLFALLKVVGSLLQVIWLCDHLGGGQKFYPSKGLPDMSQIGFMPAALYKCMAQSLPRFVDHFFKIRKSINQSTL